jgi:F-type H+-transporting ATPase subunit b
MVLGALAAELRLGLVEPGWTFVFQIANTLILFLLLKKFLFKPVTEFMANREAEVAGEYENIATKQMEADNIKEEYKEKLAKSQAEGREIVKLATAKAESKATDIIKEAHSEVVELKHKAQKDIEREQVKAVNALKDDIAEMAILTASKVIEKDIDASSHKALIDKFINEVGDTKWQN